MPDFRNAACKTNVRRWTRISEISIYPHSAAVYTFSLKKYVLDFSASTEKRLCPQVGCPQGYSSYEKPFQNLNLAFAGGLSGVFTQIGADLSKTHQNRFR
jgi:hypothetical protein